MPLPVTKEKTMGRPRSTPIPDPNRRRRVTVIGVVFTGSEPSIAKCYGMMEGPICRFTIAAARTQLMHSVAGQRRVPVEDIEVHDVMILAGHAQIDGAAASEEAAPALEEAA